MSDISATVLPPAPISLAAARRNRIQCAATARTGDQCRRYGIEDTEFCGLHAHLRGCTPEQLAAAKLCSGCHIQFFCETLNERGEVFRLCEKCRTRSAETRKQVAEITAADTAAHKCEVVGCKLKGAPIEGTAEIDKYCKLHQHQHFVDQTRALGLKLCVNHIRGCDAQMEPSYTRTRCENCLCKEREKDHLRRNGAQQAHFALPVAAIAPNVAATAPNVAATAPSVAATAPIVAATAPSVAATAPSVAATAPPVAATAPPVAATAPPVAATAPNVAAPAPPMTAGGAPGIVIPENMQICTTCCKVQQLTEFVSAVRGRSSTKTCAKCRADNKKQDARRDRVHRNELARKVYAANPESHEVKKQWVLHNRDKIADIWRAFRARKRAALGDEAYLRENADAAQAWRDANPVLVEAQYQRNKDSREYQYRVYARKARDANMEFVISFDEYVAITAIPCAYCTTLPPRGFCGVDRVDNTRGYIAENCVGCCTMCNFMKKNASRETFLNRVEHILVYNSKLAPEIGKMHPDVFDNSNGSSYYMAIKSADRRGKLMEITMEEYNDTQLHNCYLCGKPPTEIHSNGIDRIDNTRNYLPGNIAACCKTCNYLKRDHSLDKLFNKCMQIYMACIASNDGRKVGGDKGVCKTESRPSSVIDRAAYDAQYQKERKETMGVGAYRKMEADKKAAQREKKRAATGIVAKVPMTEEERRKKNSEYNAQKYRAAHPPVDAGIAIGSAVIAPTREKPRQTDEERRKKNSEYNTQKYRDAHPPADTVATKPTLPAPVPAVEKPRQTDEERREKNRIYNVEKYRVAHPQQTTEERRDATVRQTDEERREKNRLYNAAKYAAAHPPRQPQTEEERREKNRLYNAEKYRIAHGITDA